MDRHFLFLLSSARQNGNAVQLARAASVDLPPTQRWLDLTETPLPPFLDRRPALPPRPVGQLAVIAGAMKTADDIVFVAPIYWYALPAPAKLLLDHWSGWLDIPGFGFADWIKTKRVWLITTRADPDPKVTVEAESALRKSVSWLGAAWGGALHGVADDAGAILHDKDVHLRAKGFFG